MHTIRKALVLIAALVLALVGPAVTVAPAALGAAGSALDGCPASASACHYRLPSSITNARNACYSSEAVSRGIPSGGAAYRSWWNSASGSARADWTRAFTRCQDRNQLPGGKWAWGSMIYVGSD